MPRTSPALRQVVADAREQGIDLKIVVIATNPPIDTPLRDIATEVGADIPGRDGAGDEPEFGGHLQHDFDRVTLEAGQDMAKTGNPVQSSQEFRQRVDDTRTFPGRH